MHDTWNEAEDAFEAAGPPLEVSSIAWTDVGQKRENNEDGFLLFDLCRRTVHVEKTEVNINVQPPGFLTAVADGMGGHKAGQVASRLCIEDLPRAVLAEFESEDGSRASGRALTGAVERINRMIFDHASRNPELEGMGTTLVAALLSNSNAVVALVGDSRAYRLNRGTLTQLTMDQTVANYLAATQPDLQLDVRTGEMLVQAVGSQSEVEVVLTSSPLETGDLLLLCSDGLYKVVSPSELVATLERPGTLTAKAEALISRANQNGGPDNITVVLTEIRRAMAR